MRFRSAVAKGSFGLCLSFVLVILPAHAQTLLGTVRVGQGPVAIMVNAVTNKIYVANQTGKSVTVIDGVTSRTTSIATSASPFALAVNSLTNKIYVATGNSQILIIDGRTNQTSSVSAGSYPIALALNVLTNKIYVANYSSNTVTVIDGTTLAITTVPVGRRPSAIAVNTLTNTIYVADTSSNDVAVIDGVHNTLTASLPVGTRPGAVAVDEITNQVYVANYASGSVSVIDGTTNQLTTVSVGLEPVALAVDSVRNLIYVANGGDNSATIIAGSSLATTSIPLPATPVAIDINQVTNKAYFASSAEAGTVTMLDPVTDSTSTISVGAYPTAIAVDITSNTVYAANNVSNSVSVIAGAQGNPLQFMTITPCRLVDTRQPTGLFGGPAIAGGSSRTFALPRGPCSLPSAAAAYSLNVAVVPRGPLGYLTVWPTGEPQPLVSTLNSPDGRVKANAAIVPAGAAGAINIFATQTTDVVVDIDGYFVPPNGQTLQFFPLTPCRVIDTRNQYGDLGGPYLQGSRERDFPLLTSACPVPTTAQAYSLNFAAVPWQGEPMGYLTVWAAGEWQPNVATLNNPTATIVANAAIVPAGLCGGIAVYASANTNLVVDINGYFAPPASGGLSLYPSAPCRAFDTRSSSGAFRGVLAPPVSIAASPCGVPASAQAYVFNASVVPSGSLGYLTLWPDGVNMPLASTLNAIDGMIASNMAVLPNQDGAVDAYASGTTQLILDVFSYFAP